MKGSCWMGRRKYANPYAKGQKRGAWQFLYWMLGGYREDSPPLAPPGFAYPNREERVSLSSPWVSWIGHSTFLVSLEGVCFLTDPIWSERCSPSKRYGPKRHTLPPLALEDLPKIDYILISHDHYDHLDADTVRRLAKLFPQVTWMVPRGLRRWFLKRGISRGVELGWGGFYQDEALQLKMMAVPAQHSSSRCGVGDRDKSLWCGWIVESMRGGRHRSFYYAGDTGYNPVQFKEIGRGFAPIDLALIPIGAYLPRKFMTPLHVSPKESVMIHQDIGARLSVAAHWGTFKLAEESLSQPPFDLAVAMQEAGLSWETFRVLRIGQVIGWGEEEAELWDTSSKRSSQ